MRNLWGSAPQAKYVFRIMYELAFIASGSCTWVNQCIFAKNKKKSASGFSFANFNIYCIDPK
jgi:hypothetical protein